MPISEEGGLLSHPFSAHILNSSHFFSRSIQNIRIERLWRDVRKDTLEIYRQIFTHLEEEGLLDMEDSVQRLCLFLVFHPRIQASLNRTRDAWNFHKVRTAKNKTPVALWNLSRMEAISRGYR